MAKKKNKFDPTGVIPTDEQQKIIDYDIKKDDVVVIKAFAGSGKSQPYDCLVQTPTGNKAIGKIKVGEDVFGKNGTSTKVLNVYPQGLKKTFKVIFDDGTSTRCNNEHLWQVYDVDVVKVVDLDTIIKNGIFINDNYRYYIPLCDAVQYTDKNFIISPDMLGKYLGNLDLCKNRHLLDEEIRNEVINLDLDVNCNNMFIPNIYLQGSIPQRLDLLQALIDECGEIIEGKIILKVMSNKLINDIADLVRSLGGYAIVCNETNSIEIEIQLKDNPSIKWRDKKAIVKIEEMNETNQVCIEVDAKDSLYLTDNYIVTHNTFTLQLLSYIIANRNPDWKLLYLAFNTSVKNEAVKKFDNNVEPRTTHSIAYEAIGHEYRNRGKIAPGIRVTEVLNNISHDFSYSDKWIAGWIILETIKKYSFSDDISIEEKHLPWGSKYEKYISNNRYKKKYLQYSKQFWNKAIDLDTDVHITHDIYLKLYQLSKPDLSNYDLILFDECQDANAVTVAIVNEQKCPKIFVGDDHQKIYGFRGSTNAFKLIKATQIFYLTTSFRFGEKIANIANNILSTYKNEEKKLIGFKEKDYIVKNISDIQSKYTILVRTNAEVLTQAISCYENNLNFGINGGSEGLKFQYIMDVYNINQGNKFDVVDKSLLSFKSYYSLIKYADYTDDVELKRIIKLIDTYGGELPGIIDNIKINNNQLNKADVIISTVHKAKGLEYENVVLTDDFISIQEESRILRDNGRISLHVEEEINLLYVAVTRSKLRLQLNADLNVFLNNIDKNILLDCEEENTEYDNILDCLR